MTIRKMKDLDLSGKRVLIRQDLIVPISDGHYVKKLILACVALCLYSLSIDQAWAQEFQFKYPRSTVEMNLKKVSEHVYFVQGASRTATENEGFISNATVILDKDGITVVDALGTPSLAEQMLSLVRKISDLPIKRVITTHYHADHIYGLQVFESLGAKILAPLGVANYLESEIATNLLEERRFLLEPWVNEETRLVYPDQLIDNSLVIDEGGVKLTINYLGKAHSDADLTVLVEPDQVFITGDVIFEGRIPFVGDSDSKAWLETLDQLANIRGIEVLIPGHGSQARDPLKAITLTRDYLAFLRDKLSSGVEEMASFDEVYESIDWGAFEKLPAFDRANRINAYQVFLSMEKEMLDE